MTTPATQAEVAELEAINARLQQANQRLGQDLERLQTATAVRFPAEDPAAPGTTHIIRGTLDGVHALQRMLQQRFEDGRALGAAEEAERLSA